MIVTRATIGSRVYVLKQLNDINCSLWCSFLGCVLIIIKTQVRSLHSYMLVKDQLLKVERYCFQLFKMRLVRSILLIRS